MKVFQVTPDVNRYQHLLWDLPSDRLLSAPSFKGEKVSAVWNPPPVHSPKPLRPVPDIWAVGVGSGGLAFSSDAVDKLDMFLEMAGELLPLRYKSEQLMVLNILDPLDCLDESKSEWMALRNGGRSLIKPCIRSDRLVKSTLFKSAHNPYKIFSAEYKWRRGR